MRRMNGETVQWRRGLKSWIGEEAGNSPSLPRVTIETVSHLACLPRATAAGNLCVQWLMDIIR